MGVEGSLGGSGDILSRSSRVIRTLNRILVGVMILIRR